MKKAVASRGDVQVLRSWTRERLHRISILWSSDLRSVALGVSSGLAGVVKDSDCIEPAIEAVRSGLVVRSLYSYDDLGISACDHMAICLRSRAMDYEAIGIQVGYSSRQVRRRLSVICNEYGLLERDLVLLGTVLGQS